MPNPNPCAPKSECWCIDHPGHPQCPPSVPIDGFGWAFIMFIIVIIIGIISTNKN